MTNEEIDALWNRALETAYGSAIVYGFARLVAAAEREACAKVCDVVADTMLEEGEGPTGNIGWVVDCAKAIRARG